jgi:hypothetical protein
MAGASGGNATPPKMRLFELQREKGLVVYGRPRPVVGRYRPLVAAAGAVLLTAPLWVERGMYWVILPAWVILTAAGLVLLWVFLLRHVLLARRELWLDTDGHSLTFRRQRLWGLPREEVLTRADVHYIVLARKHYGRPFKLLYLVGPGGRGRYIDAGEEISRMDALAADLHQALPVPLRRFETDLSAPRLVLESETPAAVVFRDQRNYERRGGAAGRCVLGGGIVAAFSAVLLGIAWGALVSGHLFEMQVILFLAAVGVVACAGAVILAAYVVVLQSLSLVGIEVQAGPSVVLHFLPYRGPPRTETRARTEVAAVVKVANRKGVCRQVWLRWTDGRKLLLDRQAGDMTEGRLKQADASHALPELARELHERLNVPVEIERRRLTLL